MKTSTPILAAKITSPGMATLSITGIIGPSMSWWGEATGMVDLKLVQETLKEIGDFTTLEVVINSLGGDAYQGLAIGNYLASLGKPTNAKVLGVCASAAIYPALLCDTLEIPANAQLMIHEARCYPSESMTVAGCDQLKNQITATNESCVSTITAKTGIAADEVRQMMADETWMLGDEAKLKGFADTVTAKVKLAKPAPSQHVPPFKHAPANVVALLAIQPEGESILSQQTEPNKPADSTPSQAATSTPSSGPATQPTAAAPASPSQVATPDAAALQAAEQAGRQKEAARQTEIRALCQQAGPEFSKLADEFCAKPEFGTADVQQRLFQEMCKKNAAPSQGAGGAAPAQQQTEEHAAYRTEYAEQSKASPSLYSNITVEQYIASRCREDGQPVPTAKP